MRSNTLFNVLLRLEALYEICRNRARLLGLRIYNASSHFIYPSPTKSENISLGPRTPETCSLESVIAIFGGMRV